MKELGITKGKVNVISCDASSDTIYVHPTPTFGENEKNAKLLEDAINTSNECNLLPSELLERYNEAIEVLEKSLKVLKEFAEEQEYSVGEVDEDYIRLMYL